MMNIQSVSNSTRTQIWAARLELRTRLGSQEFSNGFIGGFVTIVAKCTSVLDFIKLAAEHLENEGFDILAVEELAPLSERRFEINDLIQDLANKTGAYPLQWSTFDLYRNADNE